MEQIQTFLENVKLGGKQSHLNLTVFPLLAPDTGEPDYLTLEENPDPRTGRGNRGQYGW